MRTSLRTTKTRDEYMKLIEEGILIGECKLCTKDKDEIVQEFKHWKIVTNNFPWDLIAETNHLIIPNRHIVYNELNQDEKEEFDLIKSSYIEKEYEIIAESMEKTIPSHFHLHLLILKNKIGE